MSPTGSEPAPPVAEPAGLDTLIEQARTAALAQVGDETSALDATETPGSPASEEPAATPEAALEPDETTAFFEGDPDLSKLSRAERGKVIEHFKAQADLARRDAEAAKQENERLTAQAEADRARMAGLSERLSSFLGTDEEYAQVEQAAQSGDYAATEKYFQLKQARDFATMFDDLAWGKVAGLLEATGQAHGLAKDAMAQAAQQGGFGAALDRVVQAAVAKVTESKNAELKALQDQLASERSAHDGTRARAAGRGVSPVAKGAGVHPGALAALLGADGLPTEEALEQARLGKLSALQLHRSE